MKAKIHFNPLSKLHKHIKINQHFSRPIDIIYTYNVHEVENCLEKIWRYSTIYNKWCIGFISFESAKAFDNCYQTCIDFNLPLVYFAVYDNYENLEPNYTKTENIDFKINFNHSKYIQDFNYIKDLIKNGIVYQINYTQILQNYIDKNINYSNVYYYLLSKQPNCYSIYLDYVVNTAAHKILSFSPELFFHYIPKTQTILTQPMKGTHARGKTVEQDNAFKQHLSLSLKEQAENIMIVDLMRNDLVKICTSIKVDKIFECLKLPTVWQMVSSIIGKTKPQITLFNILKALFPCGSITGTPKIAALKYINKLEQKPRDIYCGTMGLIKPGGECIFNVAIRTLYTTNVQNKIILNYGAGSGITIDANLDSEIAELYAKTVFLQ